MVYLAATCIVFWFIVRPILVLILSFCNAMGCFDEKPSNKT